MLYEQEYPITPLGCIRLQTNFEGKIFRIQGFTSVGVENYDFLQESILQIKDCYLENKNCDLLVTICAQTIKNGGYDSYDYDVEFSFPNEIVIQENYNKVLKEQIQQLDKSIIDSNIKYKELKDNMLQILYELHDDYLEGYDEDIKLLN